VIIRKRIIYNLRDMQSQRLDGNGRSRYRLVAQNDDIERGVCSSGDLFSGLAQRKAHIIKRDGMGAEAPQITAKPHRQRFGDLAGDCRIAIMDEAELMPELNDLLFELAHRLIDRTALRGERPDTSMRPSQPFRRCRIVHAMAVHCTQRVDGKRLSPPPYFVTMYDLFWS